MMMLRCALLLVIAAAGLAAGSTLFMLGHQGDDLEALCTNKSTDLTKLSQLDSLYEQLDSDRGASCSERTKAGLRALKTLIDENKGDECSMTSFLRFKSFYKEFLDDSDKERRKTFEKLPKPLKTLALAYEMEVSSLCRANMVRLLVNDVRATLTASDYEAVEKLVGQGGVISERLSYGGKRPDELIMPSDFLIVLGMAADKERTNEKIGIKMQTMPILKRIQVICARRYKPVYEPIMLPIAQMANLGFEHRGAELKKELRESFKNNVTCKDVGYWSNIVLMCEALGSIQLVEDKKDAAKAEGNDATVVRVMTPEEAEEAKKELDGTNLLDKTNYDYEGIKQLEFKPNLSVQVPDKLISTMDLSKKYSLAWINTKRDEATNIRLRFFTNTYKKLIEDLAHYKLNSFLGFFFNKIRENYRVIKRIHKEKVGEKYDIAPQDLTTELVKLFNERVDREVSPDLAVGDDLDGLGDCIAACCCCCCMDDCSCCGGGGSGNTFCFWTTNNYYGRDADRYYDRGSGQALKVIGLLILALCLIALLYVVIKFVVPCMG